MAQGSANRYRFALVDERGNVVSSDEGGLIVSDSETKAAILAIAQNVDRIATYLELIVEGGEHLADRLA